MQNESKLRMLVALAMADGELHERERDLLLRYCETLSVPATTLLTMIEHPEPLNTSDIPESPADRRACYRDLVLMSVVDGQLAPAEMALMSAVGEALRLDSGELDQILVDVFGE